MTTQNLLGTCITQVRRPLKQKRNLRYLLSSRYLIIEELNAPLYAWGKWGHCEHLLIWGLALLFCSFFFLSGWVKTISSGPFRTFGYTEDGDVAQLVECFFCIGSFEFNPKCRIKSGVMARPCNASRGKRRRIRNSGSSEATRWVKASMAYVRPCLKEKKAGRQAADWLEGRLVGLQAKQIDKDRNWIIFTKVGESKEWWFMFNANSLCLGRQYIVEIDGGDGFMRMWMYSVPQNWTRSG